MRIQPISAMRYILIAGVLVGVITSLLSTNGFLDAWSRNRWNSDLLKVALQATSTLNPIDNTISEQLERMSADQDMPKSLFYLGRVYEELGDQRAAIDSYAKAIASPDITDLDLYFQIVLLNRLGHLLFEQKRYSEAIPVLQNDIALSSRNRPMYAAQMAQGYRDLAESFYAFRGDQHAYEDYMLQAIKLRPSDIGFNEALMEHYLVWNDLEKADALDRSWRAVAPGSARPLFYTGRIYQLKGDCKKAQEYFREAIDMEPKYFLSYFWSAMCDDQLGDLESSIIGFRHAIDLAPSEWWIYRQLGNALIRNGEFVEAQDVLIKGMSLNPQDSWTQQLLEEAKRFSAQKHP